MQRFEITDKKESNSIHLITMIKEDTGLSVDNVRVVKSYNINFNFDDAKRTLLLNELFCDPVSETGSMGFCAALNSEYDFAIEIAYKPGVTDNVGRTAARGIEFISGIKIDAESVRSSTLYLFKGNLNDQQRENIAVSVLSNPMIEENRIFTKNTFKEFDYFKSAPHKTSKPYYETVNLNVSNEQLIKISEDGVLSLTLEEMLAIRDYYNQPEVTAERKRVGLPEMPTDIELELFAQTWSEHCKHKIFAANITYRHITKERRIESLFKTYIKGSADIIKKNRTDLLSLFKDNAGVVKFNDKYAYCVKAETHNSPSALDPYGGSMTGIVGVNRDIIGTGMGAYPIFNTDVFCFGSPFIEDKYVPEGLMHPRRIFRGVHRGIKDGGNESGIPTVNGSITFDDSFLGKPLVFCGTGGLMPLELNGKESYEKYTKPGDLIVMCGGRIGKDGIHGATFSSAHLTESSPTSAVQIGDPITQKKMLDFIIEARDLDLFTGITDNGAGGLASSIGEMALFTNGAKLDLEKCPLKYQGLKPWEILLSEAQERMSIAVHPDKIDQFLKLAHKRDVDAAVIGAFNDSGYFECSYNGELISRLELEMLHDGVPRLELQAEWITRDEKPLNFIVNQNYSESLKKLLQRPNIASKEHWVRMYDHEVQARTVIKPFAGKKNDGPSDGAVLKMFPDSYEGLAVTHGIMPRYSKFDTYSMTQAVIDEAVRSAIILGADPESLVGLDNFCWPDPVESEHTPDGKFKLAQLVRSCEAIYDMTIAYNCPCISGKDSMKNDYRRGSKKISVLPTLLFTVVGKVSDIRKAVSFYYKTPGELIYQIGKTKKELGGSEYYEYLKIKEGIAPIIESPEKNFEIYKSLASAIDRGIITAAHDISDGGLAVAVAEQAFSGMLGAEIKLDLFDKDLTDEEILFSESQSRIVVTVKKDDEKEFLKIMGKNNCVYLGETNNSGRLTIKSDTGTLINDDIEELKSLWQNALIF